MPWVITDYLKGTRIVADGFRLTGHGAEPIVTERRTSPAPPSPPRA